MWFAVGVGDGSGHAGAARAIEMQNTNTIRRITAAVLSTRQHSVENGGSIFATLIGFARKYRHPSGLFRATVQRCGTSLWRLDVFRHQRQVRRRSCSRVLVVVSRPSTLRFPCELDLRDERVSRNRSAAFESLATLASAEFVAYKKSTKKATKVLNIFVDYWGVAEPRIQ
jgi:hypothetical protein